MRNFLVPHSVQVDRVAGRPFFMVTASMSLDTVCLALDAVDFDGFGRCGHGRQLPGTDYCHSNALDTCGEPAPSAHRFW